MPKIDFDELDRRVKLQNAEFDALEKLVTAFHRHNLTPVVDDDYPEVRHGYESALRSFLDALKANGRRFPLSIASRMRDQTLADKYADWERSMLPDNIPPRVRREFKKIWHAGAWIMLQIAADLSSRLTEEEAEKVLTQWDEDCRTIMLAGEDA